MERETMHFDVVIVGAGPSGLSAAIRLKQLAVEHKTEINVCIVEKASEVGGHILSGAVIETRALDELLPNWKELGAPLNTPATEDLFFYLTENNFAKLPTPPQMKNKGNYIVSLANVCRWLAEQAERLGVEIFPGFAAVDLVYDSNGSVNGIVTGDMGIEKNGQRGPNYQPGVEIHADRVLIAEGCRGALAERLMEEFDLRQEAEPQSYGLGIKELWEVPEENHQPGLVVHTVGWPLDKKTYGGSFIYHLENNQIAIGYVVGLDYVNPYISPYEEFQRFKTHPLIYPMLEGGERVAYGARCLNEGGFQAIPKCSFPGGMILGCSAGFLNVPKIKGTHTAMKTGMIAAETLFEQVKHNSDINFDDQLEASWVWPELYKARNIRPGFEYGLWYGLINAAIDTYIFRGRAPWTLKLNEADHLGIEDAKKFAPIDYPLPDGEITFDKLSSVYLSNTNHEENQPCHLVLQNPELPRESNYPKYQGLEERYCPGGVYEYLRDQKGTIRLQINAQNCLHCKCCDIKDPYQNIRWTPPEGGGGPNYPNM